MDTTVQDSLSACHLQHILLSSQLFQDEQGDKTLLVHD